MKTVAQTLLQNCRQAPDKVAIHLLQSGHPDRAITYHQLIHGAAGYAIAYTAQGIQPGEVVILILNHSEDLIYSFWGTILHGAIPSIMPFLTEKLQPDHYRQALASLFEICTPAAVVTYPEFVAEVQQAAANAPSIRTILASDQVQPVVEISPETLSGQRRAADDIVLLQHSSGTTGLQKGVALSHRAVFNQIESYGRALRLKNDDVIVSWLPLYHDMGLIAGFLLPILSNTPLVLMSPFDWVRAPYKLMQAVSHYRGTLSWLPNFAYNFCTQKIRARDLENVDLSCWRAVINCSEPMVWQSQQSFLERFHPYGLQASALATCYAMAENVFAVTQGGIDKSLTIDEIEKDALLNGQIAQPAKDSANAHKMVSAGPPIDNTRVKIVDKYGQELPERHLGEIALQSDCMLSGYFHRPDLTEKAFIDGWYLTGDLGYMANGEVYITGRKKDLIIVGGKNIYPQDLERLAGEVPGVHPGRVVAFGIFNAELGTEDAALIAEVDERDESQRQKIEDAIRIAVTRGSDIALRYVHIVERGWLLKTSSGKIARNANRDKFLNEKETGIIE